MKKIIIFLIIVAFHASYSLAQSTDTLLRVKIFQIEKPNSIFPLNCSEHYTEYCLSIRNNTSKYILVLKSAFGETDSCFNTLLPVKFAQTDSLFFSLDYNSFNANYEGDSYPLQRIQIDPRESYMQSIHLKNNDNNHITKCFVVEFIVVETKKDLARIGLLMKKGLAQWPNNYNIIRKRVIF